MAINCQGNPIALGSGAPLFNKLHATNEEAGRSAEGISLHKPSLIAWNLARTLLGGRGRGKDLNVGMLQSALYTFQKLKLILRWDVTCLMLSLFLYPEDPITWLPCPSREHTESSLCRLIYGTIALQSDKSRADSEKTLHIPPSTLFLLSLPALSGSIQSPHSPVAREPLEKEYLWNVAAISPRERSHSSPDSLSS